MRLHAWLFGPLTLCVWLSRYGIERARWELGAGQWEAEIGDA